MKAIFRSAIEFVIASVAQLNAQFNFPSKIKSAFTVGGILTLLMTMGCSVPPLVGIQDEDDTFYAYRMCIESLGRTESSAKCDRIGASRGMSANQYTNHYFQYESEYQPTDSLFNKSSVGEASSSSSSNSVTDLELNAEKLQAYREYVAALDEETRMELAAKWKELAAEADSLRGLE